MLFNTENFVSTKPIILLYRKNSTINGIMDPIRPMAIPSTKNGAFTKEAHYQAKEQAVNIANALITKDVRDAIETLHGDVDTYIDNLIEKCVLEIK